jgi:hypothetical protein
MYGYGERVDHFDGVNDPLTFTAVVLEEGPRRAFIGAADLAVLPDFGRSTPSFHARVAENVGCPVDNLMLNASHTHGGPPIAGESLFERTMTGDLDGARRYRTWLYDQIASSCGIARQGWKGTKPRRT